MTELVPSPGGQAVEPLDQLRLLERSVLDCLTANPVESLFTLVGAASLLFYWAEAEANDKVNDVWDAFHYVATSLSVGYANVFPVTPLGKVIGALVMMVGPALSARLLEGPPQAAPSADPALLAKLDEILGELRRLGKAQ